MQSELSKLRAKRRRLRAKLARYGHFIRGTIMEYPKTCGNPNCRCASGQKHTGTYLVITQEGKTKNIYLPQRCLKQARQWSANYKKLKELIEQLAQVNTEILRRTKQYSP